MVTYGTTAIPSDQITVLAGATVSVSVAFENSVGLVGGMDTSSGTATPGDVVEVTDTADAVDKFGDGSELHEQVTLAFNNNAGTVYALPVEETDVTAETQSTQSGTLDNTPLDPRVNDEHTIDVVDSGGGALDVVYVDEPPTSAPTESETVEIYPPTGKYYADAAPSGSNYEFDYAHGDYSTTALQPMLDESPRIIGLCTENTSKATDLATEMNSRATNFDFMHAVAGAKVDIPTTSSYTDSIDERRLSLTYPSRGFTDDAETNEVRSVGAVAGYLASLPLGLSSTNDSIGGFASLKNDLGGPADAGDLIDEQVMPLLDYPPVTIVKDMTTSTEAKFERVYAMQITDEVTEVSHTINREFIGEQNTAANRQTLRRSHENAFIGMENGTPRMLDDFTISVSEDSSDPNAVNVSIGIDVVDVMDTIDVTITVGDIIRNGGAE